MFRKTVRFTFTAALYAGISFMFWYAALGGAQ
jgi:hypothetical protein